MLSSGLFGTRKENSVSHPHQELVEVLDIDDSEFPHKLATTSKGVIMKNYIIYFRQLRDTDVGGGGLFGNSSRGSTEIEFFALNLDTLKWSQLIVPKTNIKIDAGPFNMCAYGDKIVLLGTDKRYKEPENLIMEVLFFTFEGKSYYLSQNEI